MRYNQRYLQFNELLAFFFTYNYLSYNVWTGKTISGKIINSDFPSNVNLAKHEFSSASGAVIMGNDSIRLGTADENGIFKLEVPLNIQTLTIGWIGMYPEKFQITDTCGYFEIILLPDVIYDFVTAKKGERRRKKDRKVLPELYYEAYKRGIFKQIMPCR